MTVQNAFNNTLIAPFMYFGSDAEGDLYYRDASGRLARLGKGSPGQVLISTATIPSWQTGAAPSGAAGGSFTGTFPNPTIANNAVNFGMFQDISTGVFLGRNTAGTGDPEELTPAIARSLLGLGTSSQLNTGTTNGTIPLIGAGDKLPASIIPTLVSHEFVQVANQAARLALTSTQVQPGDEALQLDTLETYKLIGTDPSVGANWVKIADQTLDAAAIVSGILSSARLGSGTANSTTYLRGDGSWAIVPAGNTITWQTISSSQSAAVNNAYLVNSASLVTITLPTTAAVGDQILVLGRNTGGWRIAQNANQSIEYLGLSTTVGITGRIDTEITPTAARTPKATIEIVCVSANNTWQVIHPTGNLDVV